MFFCLAVKCFVIFNVGLAEYFFRWINHKFIVKELKENIKLFFGRACLGFTPASARFENTPRLRAVGNPFSSPPTILIG